MKIEIGSTTIVSSKRLYTIELDDYLILTDFDITTHKQLIPSSIKIKLQNEWMYHLQVMPIMTRELLARKVRDGEILAYQFADDISFKGNDVIYYGYITTLAMEISGTHKIPKVAMQHVWPRKLFVYLKFYNICYCGDASCVQIIYKDRCENEHIICLKALPWNRIYIMMGDLIDERHVVKETRICPTCAKCRKCSLMITYCNAHKKCTHKSYVTNGEGLKLIESRFKRCSHIRNAVSHNVVKRNKKK